MSALRISELPPVSGSVEPTRRQQRPRLYLVPNVPQTVRPTRLPETVYWKRRAAAVGMAILTMVTVYAAADAITGGGAPAPAQAAELKANDGPGWYWTVRPGDTLWSIAQAVHPQGDIRPVISRLQARYGTTPLTPGMNLLVS